MNHNLLLNCIEIQNHIIAGYIIDKYPLIIRKKHDNQNILNYLFNLYSNEKISNSNVLMRFIIKIIKQIITTMSYNKVKKNGFPDLGKYQLAYHIVREADLLSAYDFDRCMCYQMHKTNCDIYDAFINANNLFEKRMFRHNEDGLFITDYSKKESIILHTNSIKRIAAWKSILKIP